MSRQRGSVVEGQEAAARALGNVGAEVVKKARRLNLDGCLPGGRYDIAKLKKSIAANGEELKALGDGLSLKDQKTNEEIRKLKIANDIKERVVVLRSGVKGATSACIDRIRTFLEQKLENEYPSAVVGMEVPQARVYGRRVNDQILSELQKLHDEWEKI